MSMGATAIFVGLLIFGYGVYVGVKPIKVHHATIDATAALATLDLPAWVNIEIRDSRNTGIFSSGDCARSQDDIRRSLAAVALNLPRPGEADEVSIKVRVSWKPERPEWMGAYPRSVAPELGWCREGR